MVSSRKPGDASACIFAIGAEAKRQESEVDAARDKARDTAVAMHMEFCTQSLELNEVILKSVPEALVLRYRV
jgi:hypothetical protein